MTADVEELPAPARPRDLTALTVEIVLATAYVLVRWWRSSGVPTVIFQDSQKLLESSTWGWFSKGLWLGWRSPFAPLLMKLVGVTPDDAQSLVTAHVLIGSAAFILLALVLGRRTPGPSRWIVTVAVLLLGLTTPVTMWDHIVLTESLSVSLLVLAISAGVLLVERWTWPRVAFFSLVMVALVLVRDIHLVVALLVSLATGVAAVRWRRDRARLAMALTVTLVLVGVSAFMRTSTQVGERDIQATRETMFVKILPFPDRAAWFAAHGMPDADRLAAYDASMSRDPQTGTWIHPFPQYGDPGWPELSTWMRDKGQLTYYEWMATHPVDALGDWFRRPKMIWNSAADGWAFYRNPAFKGVNALGLDTIVFPPMWVMAMVGAAFVGVLVERRKRWWAEPIGVVAIVVLATGLVHGLLSWLGDPAEISRHALVAIIQLRIGVVMLGALALPELLSALRLTRPPAAAGVTPAPVPDPAG